ncbi:MAG: glycosyltransferase family 4 protein [Acidobacteria bacterium]|nr:glycosyltransferase family 4 protein [Acidobacteriota bacterium]
MFDSPDTSGAQQQTGREAAPWVLIAGGFHERGGMDKANHALATHLLARGHALHLVTHAVADALAAHARVNVHLVPRPADSYLLGEGLLARRGRAVARAVTTRHSHTRVVTNGGNCRWPDINWVHSVHHAWPPTDACAPLWFKAKNRLTHALSCRRERRAISAARLVIANSERTRRDLIEHLGLDAERVRVVYLGGDVAAHGDAVSANGRAAARSWLGVPDERPLVAFVGALGHDQNKGFDTLWRAWRSLCARAEWDADLIVAGGGRGVRNWRERVVAEKLEGRVRLLGFTERVAEVLDAADLLVSPVRYEAYGLNVHEAVARGVPALVSASAGVAERYPAELSEMILPDAEDAADLAARLLRWRSEVKTWKTRFAGLSLELSRRSWDAMAGEIVSLAEDEKHAGAGAATARTLPQAVPTR